MEFSTNEVEELKQLSPNVMRCEEGGVSYFLLPQLELPENCSPLQTDALLCPSPRDGYTCRLFFSSVIQAKKALNWNAQSVRILERNWHAFSWKINANNLRLMQMVAIHLGALR